MDRIASVASFFVSRIDAKADAQLPAGSDLRGRVAIANARTAYRRYRERFTDERWLILHDAGASPQRPLWASTGTKDAAYSDVLYVDELVVPDAINTMPEATLRAFADHGDPSVSFDWSAGAAEQTLRRARGRRRRPRRDHPRARTRRRRVVLPVLRGASRLHRAQARSGPGGSGNARRTMTGSQAMPRVLIAGAGVAGLETLLALRALAGDRVDVTILSPELKFTNRSMAVDQPFKPQRVRGLRLEDVASEFGCSLAPWCA